MPSVSFVLSLIAKANVSASTNAIASKNKHILSYIEQYGNG